MLCKDPKKYFTSKLYCRLINPVKTNTGIISKQILERINKNIGTAMLSNQGRNTRQVLDWFKGLENKHYLKCFQFYIISVYPTILESLFLKTISMIVHEELEIQENHF